MPRVHRASGIREKDLLARAKALRGSVESLLPRRTRDCPPERFDRLKAELEEVREARDDVRRLERLSRWGEPLPRAYAGLLKFHLDPGNPTIVSFPLPGGDASYAPLSRAPREAEVAVQQSDDPTRLMVGYMDWAKRGYHFYATRRNLWCTGPSNVPPEEFRAERIADLPYRLLEVPGGRRYDCPHLKDGEPRPFLSVGWSGAGITFRVCRRCVKEERHLLSSVSDGALVPEPTDEFPVSAELNVRCRGGPDCIHADLPPVPKAARRGYELGRLSDLRFLDEYIAAARERIDKAGRPTYVAGGTCYGSELGAFLDALNPTAVERRALGSALEGSDGYFEVDEPTASRALERLWPHHAETIVRTIVTDPEEARRLVDDARGAPGRVAEILKRAQQRSEERELLGQLPRYRRLSREAEWVDRVAREFRTHREAGAERAITQSLPRDGKERGLAYGFLLAIGRGAAHAWQFSSTEQEFGAALSERARELLHAPAEGYHAALDRLLASAGVADWGVREDAPP
jgi:hypothetical protein